MKTGMLILAIGSILIAGCKNSQPIPTSHSTQIAEIQNNSSKKVKTSPPNLLINLDDLIGFDDPLACRLNETSYNFLDGFIELPGDGRVLPGNLRIPQQYKSAFGELKFSKHEEDYHAARLPTAARWHGLRLKYIEKGFIGMDSSYSDFAFAESFEKVRLTLNSLGFKLDKKGSQGDPPFEGYDTALVAEDGLTVLSCSR
jgi:hypothetical protein